jgi:hypothetical protein
MSCITAEEEYELCYASSDKRRKGKLQWPLGRGDPRCVSLEEEYLP